MHEHEKNTRQEGAAKLLQDLRLNLCYLERDSVTNEIGWRAPDGYSFQLTGESEIMYNNPIFSETGMPLESRQKFIKNRSLQYLQCLQEANGDKNIAFRMLVELENDENGYFWEPGDFSESFVGKRLVITPNIDGTHTLFDDEEDSNFPVLKIVQGIVADLEAVREIIRVPEDVEYVASKYFESEDVQALRWYQVYAKPFWDSAQISIIEADVCDKFFVPEKIEPHIYVPSAYHPGLTAEDRLRFYGYEVTEANKSAMWRESRRNGLSLDDDPLRGIIEYPYLVSVEEKDITEAIERYIHGKKDGHTRFIVGEAVAETLKQ